MSSFTQRSAKLEGIAKPRPSMVSYRLIILMVLMPMTWLRVGDEVAVRVYREGEYLEMTMIMMAES